MFIRIDGSSNYHSHLASKYQINALLSTLACSQRVAPFVEVKNKLLDLIIQGNTCVQRKLANARMITNSVNFTF